MSERRRGGARSERGGRRRPQITIIGLGAMGRAVARALQAVKTDYAVVGHDRDQALAREVVAAGELDRAEWNLFAAVEEADLVVLGEAPAELVETLEQIAPHLKQGALVTDLAAVKAPILGAAERLVPAGVSFVGGHPIVDPVAAERGRRVAAGEGPEGEESDEEGAVDGRAPFRGRPWCLVPAPTASDEAVRVLGRLVRAVGAEPYYIDAEEHDALVAGAGLLPRLALASLARLLQGSPSAEDLRRLADPAMTHLLTLPTHDLSAPLAESAPARAALTRWLDALSAELAVLREALAQEDPAALLELLDAAESARVAWAAGPAEDEAAKAMRGLRGRDVVRDMLIGGWANKRKKDEG